MLIDNQIEQLLLMFDVVDQVFSSEPQSDPTILEIQAYVKLHGITQSQCVANRESLNSGVLLVWGSPDDLVTTFYPSADHDEN